MIICKSRSFASALLIAALPMGFALAGGAGGRGGAALGGGLGAEAWAVPALAAEHRREPLRVGLGRRCGGRIAGIEQPDRQRSGWNGQPKQK